MLSWREEDAKLNRGLKRRKGTKEGRGASICSSVGYGEESWILRVWKEDGRR